MIDIGKMTTDELRAHLADLRKHRFVGFDRKKSKPKKKPKKIVNLNISEEQAAEILKKLGY